MTVLVVGAGIGGATLALSLQRAGLDYLLLEQAPEFREVGAGIQLSPNGVSVLTRLGLGDDLAGFCTEPDSHKFIVWDSGEVILRTPLKPHVRAAYGHPYYHAHRADLIEALTSRLDPARLCRSTRIVEVGQNGQGAWAVDADGRRYDGAVLIGADGIHSVVREQVFRPEAPRPSGYVTWRGIVDSAAIADLEIPVSAYVDMGPKLSFVYYYVSGGRQLNWLAMGQTDNPKRESWSQQAGKEEVLAGFEGWYARPRALIEATEQPFVTALHDRDPLPGWVDGRIALTGDAAHAMLPYHAQGAVQSIEDAWVLARCLQREGGEDLPGALKRFESLRYERANRMVLHSREAEGWYHVEEPEAVERRNHRFRQNNARLNEGEFTRQQHWLYSYDAEKAALGTDEDWRALPTW